MTISLLTSTMFLSSLLLSACLGVGDTEPDVDTPSQSATSARSALDWGLVAPSGVRTTFCCIGGPAAAATTTGRGTQARPYRRHHGAN
jgi:hypothetical protein